MVHNEKQLAIYRELLLDLSVFEWDGGALEGDRAYALKLVMDAFEEAQQALLPNYINDARADLGGHNYELVANQIEWRTR